MIGQWGWRLRWERKPGCRQQQGELNEAFFIGSGKLSS